MAVDLLSRVRERRPTQDLILGRLDIDVLRAALTRATDEAIRDALDDEIAQRTHGLAPMLFRTFLGSLERKASEDRGHHATLWPGSSRTPGPKASSLVPDAGERILAPAARAERDPEARAALASALGQLGHRPPSHS